MKTITAITCTTILFFAIGIASVLLMPSAAKAGGDGCDSTCGNKYFCGPHLSCNPSWQMYRRCKQHDPPQACGSQYGWTCGCVNIGCQENCIPS